MQYPDIREYITFLFSMLDEFSMLEENVSKRGRPETYPDASLDEWGCDKPVYRVKAMSPTFGECIVIFFRDRGKVRTLLVFGKPLCACEAMRIWSQHHGIEQFWRYLKSNLHVSAMSLQSREGAYVSLGIKVMSYLMLLQISISERRTFHQIQLQLAGERHILTDFITHFHTIILKEP